MKTTYINFDSDYYKSLSEDEKRIVAKAKITGDEIANCRTAYMFQLM